MASTVNIKIRAELGNWPQLEPRPNPIDRPPPEDPDLWARVQRLVYPGRTPSTYPPFPKDGTSPNRMPASWIYHLLVENRALRDQVQP